MAQIDTSELMLDPDFIDPVEIIRRNAVVQANGKNRIMEKCIEAVASVQPISGKELMRLPEELRIKNVKSFYIQTEIVLDGDCEYPDKFKWAGKCYNVITANDWANWGAGWFKCICVAESPTG